MKRVVWLASASLASLLLTNSVWAQPASDAQPGEGAASVEQVVVTGSRISVGGTEAPTPVTVVGAAELEREASGNITEVLRNIPALDGARSPRAGGGQTSISGGGAGIYNIDLRDLGVNRTLVLFDGRRVVASALTNAVDLGTIPSSLVKRVDIVTGGASAQWGSDAVSGVVNLVLDKQFTGFLTNVQGSLSARADNGDYKTDVTYGTGFAGDKGHVILSGSYYNSPDTMLVKDRSYTHQQILAFNPAYTATNGQPRYIRASNANLVTAAANGLITSGPLANTQFDDAGRPLPFDPGQVSGNMGLGGTPNNSVARNASLNAPTEQINGFGYVSYDITSDISVSGEFEIANARSVGVGLPYVQNGNISIKADNAYLDPSIAARMTALGLTSVPFGTTNENTFGNVTSRNNRTLKRAVLGAHGTVFGDWAWDVYYEHGEVRDQERVYNDPIIANDTLAIDAVRNPNTGSIVCRSTLTNPTNGCVPIDLFGNVKPSSAALNYIYGSAVPYGINNLAQDVTSASIQGEPFTLPAGPVAIATGVEYRKESLNRQADALSAAKSFAQGNFAPYRASYNVEEGFLEAEIPLLKNAAWAKDLGLNAAARATSYSTSGLVYTWKTGLNWSITDEYKIRGTHSVDIRAPTLANLFSPYSSSQQTIFDPFTQTQVNIHQGSIGNPNLKPETSNTDTLGFVYTSDWIPGLTASIDWYNISIHGALAAPAAADVLNRCFQGQTIYCAGVIRNSAGVLTDIYGLTVNAASERVTGYDFEVNYSHDLLGGTMSWRALANWQPRHSFTDNGVTTNRAGCIGGSQADNDCSDAVGGRPKVNGNISATYTRDAFSLTGTVRYVGGGKLNPYWGPTTISAADNRVPAEAYLDLRSSYNITEGDSQIQIYFDVDNVLNQAPPAVPYTPDRSSVFFYPPYETRLYDMIGTDLRAGVRFRM